VDCVREAVYSTRYDRSGTQHGMLGQQKYQGGYQPGDCSVASLSIDGAGDPVVLLGWVGSLQLPRTSTFVHQQLQGTFVGTGGLPYRMPSGSLLWNTTAWGTLRYPPAIRDPPTWLGQGVPAQVRAELPDQRQRPPGLCANPRNVIMGEGWDTNTHGEVQR